ncbi:hypothetical protein ACJMK2_019308 [Sinanodonta woodiana]|uniref:Uncharacterized protein n=1 Tax=Sinanodonta woodiana TaxID=1069815 RepID=A0ABD3UFY7_SINWO
MVSTAPRSAWEVTWVCNNRFEIKPWRRTHTYFCEKGLWRIGDFLHCIKSVRCLYSAAPVNGEILIPESKSSDFLRRMIVLESHAIADLLVSVLQK